MLSAQICSLISPFPLIPPTSLPLPFYVACCLPIFLLFPPILYVFLHFSSCFPFLLSCLSLAALVLLNLPAPSSNSPFCHLLHSSFPCFSPSLISSIRYFKVLKSAQRLRFLFVCRAGGSLTVEIVPKEEQQPKGDFTLYSNI